MQPARSYRSVAVGDKDELERVIVGRGMKQPGRIGSSDIRGDVRADASAFVNAAAAAQRCSARRRATRSYATAVGVRPVRAASARTSLVFRRPRRVLAASSAPAGVPPVRYSSTPAITPPKLYVH